MDLNLWIICDWLNEFHPRIHCSKSSHALSGFRMYAPGQKSEDDVLYIGRVMDFLPGQEEEVVCLSQGNYIRTDTKNLNAVHNRIQDAFAFYDDWYINCAHAIEDGCALDELLNLAEPIFQMPLMVLNAAQSLAAASVGLEELVALESQHPEQLYVSVPEEKMVAFNREYSATFFNREVFLIPKGFFPTDAYCCHLFSPDLDRLGTLILKLTKGKPSEGTRFLLQQFASLIDLWIQPSQPDDTRGKLVSYFAQVLDGKTEDKIRLSRQLALLGWEPNAQKQIAVLARPDGLFRYDLQTGRFLSVPDLAVQVFPYKNNLVVLRNMDLVPEFPFQWDLRLILAREEASAAVSYSFTNLEYLSNAYLQALTILDLTPKEPGKIYNCMEVAVALSAKLTLDFTDSSLVHPVVTFFKCYDREYGTQYYETLFYYLHNESNLSRTGRDMHLQQRVVSLQLSQMQDLWPLDLKDPNLRFHLLLSYYMDQLTADPDTPKLKVFLEDKLEPGKSRKSKEHGEDALP